MLSIEAQAYMQNRGINRGRVVLHSDLNNFFASVECLKHKSLSAYPVAVCGSKEDRHGIVLAKNNLAKTYGIKTGQVIWQAKKLCPELMVLEPHYEDYVYYSHKIREIYAEFSDRVEPFGMDEAWLEITGTHACKTLEDGVRIANCLRKEVFERTGLTVSVGVSDNKTFSKLASDYKKPDAVTMFGPLQYKSLVAPLALGEMMFAGRSTQKHLASYHIFTIGDAASKDVTFFCKVLGKNGVMLYHNACGFDSSAVLPIDAEDMIKSIGNSATTPRDMTEEADVYLMLHALCDKVSSRLRRAGLNATTLQIHVRDTKLRTEEHQSALFPTNHAPDLTERAISLYKQHFPTMIPLRSIGVRATGLVKEDVEFQDSFFAPSDIQHKRNKSLDCTVDALRTRYGTQILRRGVLDTDKSLHSVVYSDKHLAEPFHTHSV